MAITFTNSKALSTIKGSSNNIAIKGIARFAAQQGDPRKRIITAATEHKCVLEAVADLEAEGFEPVVLPVRPDGLLDPDAVRDDIVNRYQSRLKEIFV